MVGRQKGPATAVWHSGRFVEIALADVLVVDAAAGTEDVDVVEGVLARFTEVVGTATETVVSWPDIVVSTRAAVGVVVVLMVPDDDQYREATGSHNKDAPSRGSSPATAEEMNANTPANESLDRYIDREGAERVTVALNERQKRFEREQLQDFCYQREMRRIAEERDQTRMDPLALVAWPKSPL